MIDHHPTIERLEQYVLGTIDASHGFAIASHLDYCSVCQAQVSELEAKVAEAAFHHSEIESASTSDDMMNMFSAIVEVAPQTIVDSTPTRPKAEYIEVANKRFQLPTQVARQISSLGEWKNYGGKVFSAPITLENNVHANLMYIAQGVSIPEHTHKGKETTLILHGGYQDQLGSYKAGDYIECTQSDIHSPETTHEDCLCLTLLTEPMLFTKGVARVFNLFGKGMYP
ncbi:ChrR family anti-sigma-E factor [Vibrio sp.]|nr:ChrR family anti-sigma-E factor [Vibrio sp.]